MGNRRYTNRPTIENQLFALGEVSITQNADGALSALGVTPQSLIVRHATGDWGNIPPEDAEDNKRRAKGGGLVMSVYEPAGMTEKVYIVTQPDRSYTMIHLASEF